MSSQQKIRDIGLLVVMLAAALALALTRDSGRLESMATEGKLSNSPLRVNETPLQTARFMARLATTLEERELAQEAVREADQELDLAYTGAIRNAQENPPPLSPARGLASSWAWPRAGVHPARALAQESPAASGVDALAHGELRRADRDAHGAALRKDPSEKPHLEMGYRSCLGIIRPAEQYSAGRMEAAPDRALRVGAYRYQSVKSILKNSLDQQPLSEGPSFPPSPPHDNIRGAYAHRSIVSNSCVHFLAT